MPKTSPSKQAKKGSSSVPIVDSLATALRILDYFTIREPELSLRELSEKSGLYKSRIHRLCGTLVALGFLTRMPSSSYRLGPRSCCCDASPPGFELPAGHADRAG